MTPTQRSLKYLRDLGYVCEVVERWNSHTKQRKDVFGFGDLLAVKPGTILLVQVTSGSNTAARVTKIVSECGEAATAWLAAGGLIEVHGWRELAAYRKDGQRKKHGRWEPRLECVTEADLQPGK